MHVVGKINTGIFKIAGFELLADEVVLTDPQLQHILKNHPNSFELYQGYIQSILLDPDFIVEANRSNSALLAKTITETEISFKLVLRLKTADDPEQYMNSIITFMKSDAKELSRLSRNKKVLYKRE